GFRNREFTMYAVPVLVAIELLAGELTRSRVRDWLVALVMFVAVWETISALMPFADLAGPGTRGQLLGGFSGSQIDNLLNRFNAQPGEMGGRVTNLLPRLLAWFLGGAQVETSFPVSDHRWLVWAGAALLLAIAARLLWLTLPSGTWRGRHTFARAVQLALVR